MKRIYPLGIGLGLLLGPAFGLQAQSTAQIQAAESEYYQIVDVPIPDEIVLEVGGLALTDQDQLGVSTRRGEVWLLDKPYGKAPVYKRYAHGLHEALGLAYRDNGFYLSQRGELSRLEDRNNDGKADLYKTIYSWPLSGNYHDYSYGPKFTPEGDMLVTLNLGWEGRGVSLVKWRGWLLKITPEGEMTPLATGLRSPAGFVVNEVGDVFYSDNQGDWVGSGRMTHLEVGDFAGNPEGLKWTDDPQSPLDLKPEDIEPQSGLSLYEYARKVPGVKPPAIWFPHTILGISTSDILIDDRGGAFGPFEGQMLVGDQGHSKIMRVFMEKVNGVYQGAAFPFREGFSSGIIRMIWGSDASMFVGMTSRGWASTGEEDYGLQRLVWTGKTPFEIKTMKALNNGFELEFTKPVKRSLATNTDLYRMASFNYLYHNTYGSPVVDQAPAEVTAATVSDDGTKVTLEISGMRLGYIHQLGIYGLQSTGGESLLHNTGYYTLNQVPGGELKSPSLPQVVQEVKEQPKRINEQPVLWLNGPDAQITVSTKPGLKYDREEIELPASGLIEMTFNNNDDMLHNLVVVRGGPEAADEVGEMAMQLGLEGETMNYVPDTWQVVAHTGILQPGETEKVYFKAPDESGEYWIVCTFPGHYLSMRARIVVKEST